MIANVDHFMQAIEKYFGSYTNQNVKAAVKSFIRDNWDTNELDSLLNTTIKKYSTSYNTQPDVSFFNSLSLSIEAIAEQEWSKLVNKYSGTPILCVNPITQEVVKSYGSFDKFCEEKARDLYWTHKDFITRFISFSKVNSKIEPEILKGFNEIYYNKPITKDNVILIGDPGEGKILLDKINLTAIEYKQNDSDEMKAIGDILPKVVPKD